VEKRFLGVAAVIAVAALGLHNGSAQDRPTPEKQLVVVCQIAREETPVVGWTLARRKEGQEMRS
jgi:hypothetical protein